MIQHRTNNIIEWRDTTYTDLLSFMVDESLPHLVDPSDWQHGWCYASGSQFHYRAKPMSSAVDSLLAELGLAPIDHVDIGSQMNCTLATGPSIKNSFSTDSKPINSRFSTGVSQNFPNPFYQSTQISYSLSRSMPVRLSVFDLLGREVLQLVEGEKEEGVHTIAVGDSGLAPGVYLYSLDTPEGRFVRKMIVR